MENNRETLIFVDDEPEILDILSDIFAPENYAILTAQTGKQAFELLRTGPVDLILCDLKLPDASGLEIIRTAKTFHPDVKAILTTGYFDPSESMVENQGKIIDRVLFKPWDIAMLRREVKGLLKQNGKKRQEKPVDSKRETTGL